MNEPRKDDSTRLIRIIVRMVTIKACVLAGGAFLVLTDGVFRVLAIVLLLCLTAVLLRPLIMLMREQGRIK